MRVFGWFKPPCEMKVTDEKVSYRHHRPINIYMSRFESEHNCWDPKDGDLCLNRMKAIERWLEV